MSQKKRIVIVGGVAGGASAAARARRLSEDVDIVLFERGEHISFANCGLPYHIGGAIAERERLLVATPESMRQRFRIDVRTRCEVTRINREQKEISVRNLATGEESTEPYDTLILSPGAAPVRPPLPGADSPGVFTLRNIADMDAIKSVVDNDKPKQAVVVGGGYIGLEMAEALRQRGVGTSLVELADQVFIAADPEMIAPVHQQLELHGVDLRLGTSITEIRKSDGNLHAILSTGESIEAGLIILAIGVRPENQLAKEAGLEIGKTGGILVDEQMRTSDPDIYAVGDAVEVTNLVSGQKVLIPLAGPANRQGRIAADNALGREAAYTATQGTAICKVFDLAVGMTGMNEKSLKQSGVRYEKVFVHPSSHAGYYPGAVQLSLKLLFDPEDGKILGAQAVGADGIDKRIDVLAVAIRAGLTVRDLAEQELAYAPPYGSAKDPINYAGFVACNVLDGLVKLCHVDDVVSPGENQVLLDVRGPKEIEMGTIPGAKCIPLDQLRGRLGELPRDKEILAFCQVGLRGYLACRILTLNGFDCRNLTGGYKTYRASVGPLPATESPKREPAKDTGPRDPAPRTVTQVQVVREIDARGLQCPGPIMQLRDVLDELEPGQAVNIVAGDPGFPADVQAWCESTGNQLIDAYSEGGGFRAVVAKNRPAKQASSLETSSAGATSGELAEMKKHKTMVVFSGDLDKAIAAFIIANGATAMGSKVTMFFTFWGLNVLRRAERVSVKKNLIERMFGWMMPRGPNRLGLSKMNMGGMGAAMIKGIMRKKNVASLPELIHSAQASGVRLIACTMSMDLMGIHREELIDGLEEAGVAMFLNSAEAGNVNLFI